VPVETLGTREIAVSELVFFPGNARRGNIGEIRKSVRRLGQFRPVCVRECDEGLVILAGNHTVRAMAAEGLPAVQCAVVRCTDDEARRVNIADNRLSDLAAEDGDALAELLSYLDDDYEGTGWTAEDVAKLIEPGLPEGDAPADDLPVTWGVIVECDTEEQQADLLASLDGRGFRVRAIMT
jgi:ParB-like chromosome segregation protein Spo0J